MIGVHLNRRVAVAKVMIVDDDRTTVKLLRTLLELDGFDVSIVPLGSDVLQQARKERPDLFLIDYHLADIDGVEVIVSLRADPSFANSPIVMASGLDVETEARKAGATTFLVKPFEPDALSALFNQLIAAK
jgi:two-component system chemotaxis response regulator CheY